MGERKNTTLGNHNKFSQSGIKEQILLALSFAFSRISVSEASITRFWPFSSNDLDKTSATFAVRTISWYPLRAIYLDIIFWIKRTKRLTFIYL